MQAITRCKSNEGLLMEKIEIPVFVVEHCNKYKLCKGCGINCVAPVSDRDFSKWIKTMIEKVKNYEL